MKLNRGQFQ